MNPKISLKLEHVTCAEAVAALSEAAGVPVQLLSPQPPGAPRPPLPPHLDEPTSFDWTGVTFSHALRQLCDHYNLASNRNLMAGGYNLQPRTAPPGSPRAPVGLVEEQGVRLFLRGITVQHTCGLDFATETGTGQSTVSLQMGGQFVDGDADSLAGLQNLAARDDQGQILVYEPRPGPDPILSGFGPFPDEWNGNLLLTGLHPHARMLEWIEGDLDVYATCQPLQFEVPLPLPAAGTRVEAGDVVLEIHGFEPGPTRAASAAQEKRPSWFGARLYGSISAPLGSEINVPRNPLMTGARLVGASGKTYGPNGSRTGMSAEGRPIDIGYDFPGIDEPVVKAILQMVRKADPRKRLSFRIHEIPLPPEHPLAPQRFPAVPARQAAWRRSGEQTYHDPGGGCLVCSVRIQNEPAPEGTLSCGLSATSGEAWDGTSWIDRDVGSDGIARVEALRPGAYRLLRSYRPKQPADVTGTGRWLHADVTVEVAAGQETTPPPLCWVPESEC